MTRVSNRSRGFTLIELLVVIGIIAVMIGILFPVVGSALNRASKARAQNDMVQIVAAIKAYYGDNGKMPVPAGHNSTNSPDRTYGNKSMAFKQNVVMNILRGIDTTINRGGRVYLDMERTETNAVSDKNGNSYVPADGYFLDPWDNPYLIVTDTDCNGDALFTGVDAPPASAASFSVNGALAAVASYGPDPSNTNSFLISTGK